MDNRSELTAVLPQRVSQCVAKYEGIDFEFSEIKEIVMDLDRPVEVRTSQRAIVLEEAGPITEEDLKFVFSHKLVGKKTRKNRYGITGSLHRLSAIVDHAQEIVGCTLRVGRTTNTMYSLVEDIVESGKSVLLLGRPGVGKTSLLREICNGLSEYNFVVIVDSSDEIAGDGRAPHPSVGMSRRLSVPYELPQDRVMIEAVENHAPEVVVVDEISTFNEAKAANTIAQRGVQLIGTAHGRKLEDLLQNDELSHLLGKTKIVTLTDANAAKATNGKKSVVERATPPVFEVLVEVHAFDEVHVYHNLEKAVDTILDGREYAPEIRRLFNGALQKIQKENEVTQRIDFPEELQVRYANADKRSRATTSSREFRKNGRRKPRR